MTRTLRRLLPLLVLLASMQASAQVQAVGDGGPGPVKALHLTAELVSLAPSVSPGGSVEVGLVISPEEKWHIYWLNAGDSGEPPAIKWTLPSGVSAGPMQFPTPSRLPLGPLMDFGYEDNTAFPVKISVASTVKPGPIHLDAEVSWLVCREVCIPGKAHMGLDLAVAAGARQGQLLGTLGEALKSVPTPVPATWKLTANADSKEFVFTVLNGPKINPDDVEFYPVDPDLIVNAGDQEVEPISGGFRVRVPRSPDLATLPASLHGVLKLSEQEGYEFTAPVIPGSAGPHGGRSAVHVTSAVANQNLAGTAPNKLAAISATLLAFLGGIILNLMPCVFPVLFLKGLALVQSSGEERARIRRHGLIYTLGILVSFWMIVSVLLVVRGTGSRVGWGFQLQSPWFIAVLASVLFFFALSLAGQFELGLSLTSAGGELARKEGFAGSFFTGVLATVVATPCTAPLMGAAIGFALAQSPAITFAVFTALALGLAFPYLLLTLQPAWTRWLPPPGAWMEILKQLTAVPLFATVIGLAWVYGRLNTGGNAGSESDHLAGLLLCFLFLAIAGWALGRWPARWGSAIAATLLVICGLAIPLSHPPVAAAHLAGTGASVPTSEADLSWQPYSSASLDQAHAAGHPVFIDFTAAWCLSCQVNEKLVLRSKEVEGQLSQHRFTLLRADWTQYDPAITAQLASLNRSGVPTYVIYPVSGKPDILPEFLTKDEVLKAIATTK